MLNSLLAGSAKVDITPPLTIPYLGYEPRHALFQGVHDPLYARAVALDDGATQVILLAVDAIGYSNDLLGPGRNFTAEVRQRIQAHTGVPAAHIMLATTHAHSTPETCNLRRLLDTPATAPWLEVVLDQLTSAAAMAFAQRKPSRLKAAAGMVEGLARNRRVIGKDGRILAGPEITPTDVEGTAGPVDPTVGVLYLEGTETPTCTLLTNFACHPVTVQVQPLVSADFPGAAMALVEKSLPNCANSLFFQGACGDINPIRNTTDFEDVERYGLMLGGEVIKLAAQMSAPDYAEITPRIQVKSATIALTVRELPDRVSTQEKYTLLKNKQKAAKSEEERSQWARTLRLAEEKLALIERGAEPLPAEIQVIRLGDVALVSLPGEPFTELGLAIKQRSPARQTFVIGYANDWIGYLTTPQAWQQGGYEVGEGPWTRVGPAGGYQLVDKAVDMLAELWQ
ncbi:MAG: neutral/alkaline non-lysosomal ceramidase N-terminal domain-containing protein [Caldilineaceae bacterium]